MTTTERPTAKRFVAPPPIITAECSICGADLDGGGRLSCWSCGASWSFRDDVGTFRGSAQDQCPSEINRPQEGALRCVLTKGHGTDHRGVPIHDDGSQDDTADSDQVGAWSDADAKRYPNSAVVEHDGRRHRMGDPESADVTVVRDRDRDRWTRDGVGMWRTDSGDPLAWTELLSLWGPVVEISTEARP